MLGPIMGGALNSAFGYFWCYVILACFLGVAMVVQLFVMPNSINKNTNKEEENGENQAELLENDEDNALSKKVKDGVRYSWFLCNRRSAFALLSCSMVMIFVSFKQAFMTLELEGQFNLKPVVHGWVIALPSLFFVISGNIVGRIIDMAPRRIFLLIAFVCMAISTSLMGPSQLFRIQSFFYDQDE
jgi:predicted MFS family arabinose efflux permease